MKHHHPLSDLIFSFWFVWFAIAGVLLAAFINWIFSAGFKTDDLLVMGATLGIITGGVSTLMFFIIGKSRKLEGFGERFHRRK